MAILKTIKNNGNVDYNFDIQLLSVGESEDLFSPEYIKIKVDNDEITTLNNLTNSKIKTNITLAAQDSMDISIRVWLSSTTPNNQIGKSFDCKLVIDGQAVQTSSNYGITAASYITNLYNNANKTEVTNNNIKYNYATSVSLMNDRLGGTTKDLNAGNIRYYGANPNNYIYFNCTDYDNQSADTCEVWRIIGVFDNMIKIIRDESIGTFSWDTSVEGINSGNGINEWNQADIMKLLNPGYENNQLDGDDAIKVNNSLYWNGSSNGNCYNGQSNAYTTCNFSNTGLKNEETRNRIATVTWNLGGFSSSDILSPNNLYLLERGHAHMINPADGVQRQDTWTGRVALIYPSDYGYSVEFGTEKCTSLLSSYSDEICTNNNWLYNSAYARLTISSRSDKLNIWTIYGAGHIANAGIYTGWNRVHPTLFLNSEEIIKAGNGSSSTPYQIK